MRFRQAKKGRQVPANIVHGGTDGERRFRVQGEQWLAGA
jgi:hypothetical protein